MKHSLLPFFSLLSLSAWGSVTSYTIAENQTVLQQLPFQNRQDFEDTSRGFIAPLPNGGIIKDAEGKVVWDLAQYQFLKGKAMAPTSVNPSLWRQAQLLRQAGLFQVTDQIYQIRGADISNMTIVEGKTGIIIIDPLMSIETAQAALSLYYEHRPKKPIKAVIYTHSHVDHFGGVRGVISDEDVKSKRVKVYAPQGFTEAALDENVLVGNVMARRASYMYGSLLKPGEQGQMTSGLGLTTSLGHISLILPTDLIAATGEKRIIDGVRMVFLFAPHSEAPTEMLFYFPDLKALCAAEDATHTMHNIYSLRGAKVRDARAWAHYLNQTIEMFGEKAEVVFASHHWPTWGKERVIEFLEKQRDLYKYLHDQSVRLANQGYTMLEIGEMIQLPKSLSDEWYNRGYYGTLNHNAKSVYNFYLGWFDGNPSTLHQLPPVEASLKTVEYMGGAESVLKKASQDYALGNYRWVAQVLNHVVFADPLNQQAKDLLANTLEQLGFQAECGPWRNFYLSGAQELRKGVIKEPIVYLASPDVIGAMPTEALLDYFAIRLDGPRAADHTLSISLELPDRKESYLLQIKNGVLNYFSNRKGNVDATATLNRTVLDAILMNKLNFKAARETKKILIQGNEKAFELFLSLFDRFDFWFNLVEPNPQTNHVET
jgi:alkyl sulfatase BDS1-like metallo-beta-lactamase superfamily hydrolase